MSATEESTYTILKHDLSKYLPIRVVLRKDEDGRLTGLIENSFSLDFSANRIRIWWSGNAYSFLGEHNLNGIEDATHNSKPGDIIVDPFAEDCPIEIDWGAWLKSTNKFDKRNAPFKIKEKI